MKNIQHIFFDLDHTLWDFETNSDLAFKTIFKQNKIEVNYDSFLAPYREINKKYWKLYREDKVTKEVLRYGRLKEAFNAINFSISDCLIHKLAKDYLAELPNNNYLFAGTHDILNYLQAKYQLHIITNGFNEVQNNKLKQSDLYNYFKVIITSEKAGVKKPHPKIFEYALHKAKASANQSVMIGDNLEADILGAKQAGLHAIYFNPEKKLKVNSVTQITELLELKKYL